MGNFITWLFQSNKNSSVGVDNADIVWYDGATEFVMNCDTIKYKIVQSPETKNLTLQVYRPYGEKNDEWMIVDHFNELSIDEVRCLCEYLISLFNKRKQNENQS